MCRAPRHDRSLAMAAMRTARSRRITAPSATSGTWVTRAGTTGGERTERDPPAAVHHRRVDSLTAARRHRRGLGAHPRGHRAADPGIRRDGRRQGRRRPVVRRGRRRASARTCRSSTSGCRRPSATRACGPRSRRAGACPARRSSCSASTSSGSTRPSSSRIAPAASATCSRTGSATSASSWTPCAASPAAARRSIPRSSPSSWSATGPTTRSSALTPREREVLAAMAEGRTNVGHRRRCSASREGATEKHISNIFGKLELPDSQNDHRRVLAVLTYLGLLARRPGASRSAPPRRPPGAPRARASGRRPGWTP